MSECVFCAIVAKEVPVEEILYEDAAAIAFLDAKPRAPGHTVVVPKHHTETIMELSDEEGKDFMKATREVDRALMRALKADGMTIGINQGKAAGQAVPHLHLHLIPRITGDGGGSFHTVVERASTESLHSISERVRACIERGDVVH